MKLSYKLIVTAVAFIASLTANAATQPASITIFTPSAPTNILNAKISSWGDPAFGNMGWTHSSGWGTFTAKAGKKITINAVSTIPGFHPGITVWSRGKDDTAPDNYVVDHFYAQNANFVEFGAKDEVTGAVIGNISMQIAAYGYDLDGHVAQPFLTILNGVKDRVQGQMKLTFEARKTATYMFVVGGVDPAASLISDPILSVGKKPITVTVTSK